MEKTLSSRWKSWVIQRKPLRRRASSHAPLRGELFNVTQLSRHATALANTHQVVERARSNTLLSRLEDNEDVLRSFNRDTLAVNKKRRVTPAAEWLLDNWYLVEEQIQLARRHFPRSYNRELPWLTTGASAGLPRVYDIVLELISHVDAQIDVDSLTAFVAAYQTAQPLKLGELWAIPIMLRLGLIENLRRVTSRLTLARADRDLADRWVDRLQDMAERNPSHLVVVVADMARSDLPTSSSFVAQFCQRLSRQSSVPDLARSWLHQRLGEQGLSIEQLIQEESQLQAADQVSVSHSITSIRALAAMDWKEFVETLSSVEHTLRSDPASVYGGMDFHTRDYYRHAVEGLARRSQISERDVARRAVTLAEGGAQEHGRNDRAAHVGYYLVDAGRSRLEQDLEASLTWRIVVTRAIRRFPLVYYLGGIALLTGIVTATFVAEARSIQVSGWRLTLLSSAVALCASQLAVTLMNWLSTLLIRPHLLPRIDYSAGLAQNCRTLVVIPTLLTSPEDVDRLVETLEIHHLANRDPHLHFALLTDFRDAPKETMPDDDALLAKAKSGIEALNTRYRSDRDGSFFLLHRPRLWNEKEGCWMGYERKRGKLMELNSLLRSGASDRFTTVVGDKFKLTAIKYVITLDTDTQLPRETAHRLVGIMEHPLNRPGFDSERRVVTSGYGIMQPRVGVSLPSADRSWFARLYAGEAGLDPYTRTVSDVYQDVFQEGSFIGKGIYNVDAFERALAGRFPPNRILSHDLLEACHARSALVTDVELFEDHPSSYTVDIGRRHRWIRGDWQIARWLSRRVPESDGRRASNPLSPLSQWKILDNLRRSLVPIALLALIFGSWILLPSASAMGFWFVVVVLTIPSALFGVADLCRRSSDLPWSLHLRGVGRGRGRQLAQAILSLVFLPYEAFVSFDAIAKTFIRLLFTRRRLLEWQASSEAARRARGNLASFYGVMWASPIVALAAIACLVIDAPQSPPLAIPVLGVWFLAPAIAWWLSRPIIPRPLDLSIERVTYLRHVARRTWHYFETFVTAQENWLPPDNFQEVPSPVIATRTSPTNIGLSLLANLSAKEFGYLSAGGLLRRTADTFSTLQRLKRYEGHFYNWYETRTLQALLPLYVSVVDSGNLCGYLMTLGSGLRELPSESIISPRIFRGLADTVAELRAMAPKTLLLEELAQELEPTRPEGDVSKEDDSPKPSGARLLVESYQRLKRASELAARIVASAINEIEDVKRWSHALDFACRDYLDDLLALAPWLSLVSSEDFTEDLTLPGDRATLREISELDETLGPEIETRLNALSSDFAPRKAFLVELLRAIRAASDQARERLSTIERLAQMAEGFADVNFTFLADPARELFAIGYNVSERRRDNSYFDLLASESRLATYVAIAQGEVPQSYWFSLGRLLVPAQGTPILISWSGSMFEYLMPMLIMPHYERTLLDHTCKAAVHRQIEYGRLHGVPWGISESSYHWTDAQFTYQYRAFGVPGLGLKRGLADDLVIAPYATVMALMVDPRAACENLERLTKEGREGAYGFYEAIDYTPSRLPPDQTSVTIRSFMVHHLGMSLLSLDHLLNGQPMQRRFMACPQFRAADLLLQERIPKTTANVLSSHETDHDDSRIRAETKSSPMRVISDPSLANPESHLLSNGRYHVAITSAGGGFSRWRDLAVTRWREDATCDSWGSFIYLRDLTTGEFWSASHQPTLRITKNYEAIFTQSRAEFRHRHAGLEAHTEITVSPEDDVELRRVTLINHSQTSRIVELTSYAEVVLAPPAADAAHPAFSNLFVQTEFAQPSSAIICTRRARSASERPPWLLHLLVGRGGAQGEISCETDRARFVGRGHTLARPAALQTTGPLSNTTGSVLDPIIALRRTLTLGPNETITVGLVYGVSESRDTTMTYIDKYQNARLIDRAFDLAWTHGQVTLNQLNISEAEAQLYGRLAAALLYADPARRADPSILLANRRGQNGLWGYGISGDTPIVLLRMNASDGIDVVRQLTQAHAYWRTKGLMVDLVILNEDASVYRQSLQDQISTLIAAGLGAPLLDKPGGIFIRRAEQISPEDRILLQSVARIVMDAEHGSLAEQVEKRVVIEPSAPALRPTRSLLTQPEPSLTPRELIFKNDRGGFTHDGREYVITLNPGQTTPAPWINVIANPFFGTVVSESGSSYTWVENAHEFRLTPWHNDPIQDPTGEAFYLRDEHTGQFWSPTPLPARGSTPYVIRHGFGYTVFEHAEQGIVSELIIYVAMDAPVKFATLKVRNTSGTARRISATGYWEWVLGESRHKSLLHVQTEIDVKSGALLARNHYNTDFPDRIAFVDSTEPGRSVTGDRREFLGRNGRMSQPAAMKRSRLAGKVGAGLDPCGSIQVILDLEAGEERETTFRLGVGRNLADVRALIQRFRHAEAGRAALERVWSFWNRTLGAVYVETPDASVNVMANGWLLYQTLSCRFWGRTGFYQSGGAYGFRDQLQDSMALVHSEPGLVREHLLRAASRQFREGDVQHWWHPPIGRGVRTHFSDDYLWLPYVVCRYVSCVADVGVLDEMIPFLDARPVKPEEEAYYDLPTVSQESASLYDHCVRAIDRGMRLLGSHGLPLMGCGDWNDGMNRVGHEGRGESVWLAFFLHDTLKRFSSLSRARGDVALADRCVAQAAQLQQSIEQNAWDGEWYRRAYFDDGTPLGSRTSEECQIDSLPQSWAVISGAGDLERTRQAMRAVRERLIRPDDRLIQLFDPPFDHWSRDPGYIKGYIPGVRENGGQYTHGAIWTVMAYALLGETEEAWSLYHLLNPPLHADTPEKSARYKVEPYVVAADVYGVAPHTGRGGWTWYTGSAGWMYRLLIETLLGAHLEGANLRLAPCFPKAWSFFKINYRYRSTLYRIAVSRAEKTPAGQSARPAGVSLILDGNPLPGSAFALVDDHRDHVIIATVETG